MAKRDGHTNVIHIPYRLKTGMASAVKAACLVLCLCLVLPYLSYAASANVNYSMRQQGEEITLTYGLYDVEGSFVDTVIERLKAGQVILVRHHADIRENGWLGKEKGSMKFVWKLAYNHLEDGFTIEEEGDQNPTLVDETALKEMMLHVPVEPFAGADAFKTAQEYRLSFNVTFDVAKNKNTRWTRWLSMGWDGWQPTLSTEVLYIAR